MVKDRSVLLRTKTAIGSVICNKMHLRIMEQFKIKCFDLCWLHFMAFLALSQPFWDLLLLQKAEWAFEMTYFKLCHLFKIRIGMAPTYLCNDFSLISATHSYSTRDSDVNFVARPNEFPPNTFHYSSIREWNRLPSELKRVKTLAAFKRGLRQYLSS